MQVGLQNSGWEASSKSMLDFKSKELLFSFERAGAVSLDWSAYFDILYVCFYRPRFYADVGSACLGVETSSRTVCTPPVSEPKWQTATSY